MRRGSRELISAHLRTVRCVSLILDLGRFIILQHGKKMKREGVASEKPRTKKYVFHNLDKEKVRHYLV